jgi:hypothetical protein
VLHVKYRHKVENIKKIYSKFDLIKQYQSLMKEEIGFEHYFMNYFLYLPFSKEQEFKTVVETLKLMNEWGICKFNEKNEVEFFLREIENIFVKN